LAHPPPFGYDSPAMEPADSTTHAPCPMERRAFLSVLAGGLLTAPLTAKAQQTGKVYRLGFLGIGGAPHLVEVLVQRLRELGYVEGQNLVIERRYTEGNMERIPTLAAELVGLKVDVIVALGTAATQAFRRETATIPIVMVGGVDPVGAGLVASLARPGGNVTGLLQDVGQGVLVKTLEILRELVPKSSRVAVLVGPLQQNIDAFNLLKLAATTLTVALQPVTIQSPGDIEAAFAAMVRDRTDALLVLPNPLVIAHRRRVVDLAARHRIPAAYWWREMVSVGGLISYGVDWPDLFRRAATLVDKILKGAKPADLPVEQPTKFELVINLKTAKALKLTIPQSLLLRADEVIE